MELGPASVLTIQFKDKQFKGEILAALVELVQAGTIRVVDAVAVKKDAAGTLTATEINQLSEKDLRVFDPLQAKVTGLLSHDDIQDIGALLENQSAAGILILEHIWATKLAQAIQNSGGTVVLNRLLMPEVVAENLAIIENIA